ncbi:MAG: hypothetical protein WBP64_11265, partial [Nitrososphaeraceae archaeon]
AVTLMMIMEEHLPKISGKEYLQTAAEYLNAKNMLYTSSKSLTRESNRGHLDTRDAISVQVRSPQYLLYPGTWSTCKMYPRYLKILALMFLRAA